MKLRIIALITLALFNFAAQAQSNFGSFDWKSDDSFDFRVTYNGQAVQFKGPLVQEIIDGKKTGHWSASAVNGNLSFEMYYFSEGSGYAIIKNTDTASDLDLNAGNPYHADIAYTFLFERDNKVFRPLLATGIPGPELTMALDMKGIISALKGEGRPMLVFRNMAEYYMEKPVVELKDSAGNFTGVRPTNIGDYYVLIEEEKVETIFVPDIGDTVVRNGVVQLPEEKGRPQRLDVPKSGEQPAVVEEPVLEPVDPVEPPVELLPPADIPETEWNHETDWEAEEAERARLERERRKRERNGSNDDDDVIFLDFN